MSRFLRSHRITVFTLAGLIGLPAVLSLEGMDGLDGLNGFVSTAEAVTRDLGVADSIALDQPRVFVQFETLPTPGDTPGPIEYFNGFVLDTGANATLVGSAAYLEFTGLSFELNPNLYERAQRTDTDAINAFGPSIKYYEQGVAGLSQFDLLAPMNLNYAGHNGDVLGDFQQTTSATIPAQFALGAPELDLGGFGGIVGMPGMVDKIVSMNLSAMTPNDGFFLGYLGVDFPASAPAAPSPADSYTVSLDQLAPVFSGKEHPTDPNPTFSPLPLIPNITTGANALTTTGSYLLDTGAQLSMITMDTALALGIDPEADAVDILEVGGVGGSTFVPLVEIDTITIATNDGTDLVQNNITVGILDVEGLPVAGIFGMNLLTGGYLDHLLLDGDDGMFSQIVMDFTDEEDWTMRLDVSPGYVPRTSADDVNNILGNTSLYRDQALLAFDPGIGNQFRGVPEPATAMVVLLTGAVASMSRRALHCRL